MSEAWRDLISAVEDVEPPMDLWTEVVRREGQMAPRPTSWRVPRWGIVALAAAGCAAVIFLLALAAHSRSSSPGPATSQHAAISPSQARVELAAVPHLRVKVDTKDRTSSCTTVPQRPGGTAVPLRYSVSAVDTRMPAYPGNSDRPFIEALVFPHISEAASCYRFLRASDYTTTVSHHGQPLRQVKLHPKRVGRYTLEIYPHKPGQPGVPAHWTGQYDLVILNGHTVVFGMSHNAAHAALVEADGIKVRDIIGD